MLTLKELESKIQEMESGCRVVEDMIGDTNSEDQNLQLQLLLDRRWEEVLALHNDKFKLLNPDSEFDNLAWPSE